MQQEKSAIEIVHQTDSSLSSSHRAIPLMNMIFSIKLDQTNFLLWQEHLMTLISAHGLEKIIDASSPIQLPTMPTSQIPNHDHVNWSRMIGIMKSKIFTSVSTSASVLLVQRGIAAQYWSTFESAFSSFSHARVMDLLSSFKQFVKINPPLMIT